MALGALGTAVLFALASGAMAQDSSSPHDRLTDWVGHWRTRIETKETQFSHAATEDFDGKCSMLPHGTFVVCEYVGLQPDADDGRVRNDVVLIYYSDVDKTFKFTTVLPEGGPREDLMSVDGRIWTRPFEIPRRSGGVANARETYDFVSPKKRRARLEISIDQGAHWTLVNEAASTRVN